MIRAGGISMEAMHDIDRKRMAVIAIGALTMFWALFVAPPGYFVIDEGIYHLMTDAVPWSGGLFVWNGYEEFPTRELDLKLTKPYDGRLAPQYPYLSALIYYPFYFVLGLRGLVVANALAAVATLWLTYRLARDAFGDRQLALNACLILALATYFWEYSQAMWPHAIATAVVVGAVYLTFRALELEKGWRALGFAAAAGGVIGFGVGVRLDVIFVVPALVLPFLFARPWRPGPALAVLAGLIPGLLVLAATNDIKFGIFTPFAYGASEGAAKQQAGTYAELALYGLAGTLAAWLLRHGLAERRRPAWRRGFFVLAGAIAVAVLSMPSFWQLVQHLLAGGYRLLVDFRIPLDETVPGGAVHGPGGGMIFGNGVKKALLQSCPYLPLLGLLAVGLFRGSRDRAALWLLVLAPAGVFGVYASLAWFSEGAINMRYFVPALPFLAILSALAWKETGITLTGRVKRIYTAILAVGVYAITALSIGMLFATSGEPNLAYLELVYLDFPLAVAAVVAIFTLAKAAGGTRLSGPRVDGILTGVLAVALAWSLLAAFASDYIRSHGIRSINLAVIHQLRAVVDRDSLVLAPSPNAFFPLIAERHVRVALPWRDAYEDADRLVAHHLSAGRPVYLWSNAPSDEVIDRRYPWEGLSYELIAAENGKWRLFRMRTDHPAETGGE